MIGKTIDGKYKIEELLGSGGMAKVYKARDIRLERIVAVKVLKEEYADNEQFVNKFMKEAKADAKLAHHNIVGIYDVGEDDGLPYIVMEYINGPTLKEYITEKGQLSPHETIDIIYSVTLGIAQAHKNGIIHRDIKPQNILLTSNRVPKVADFGIATAITSSTLTATEEALGSVHYVSPEQARGGFLDERSDLYSLGIMMYEMLTGKLPYDGDSPVAVALMHVQNDVPSPKNLVRRIPDGVAQMVLNLTRRKTQNRYQNANDLLSDLKKLKNDINAEIAPTYGKNKVSSRRRAIAEKNRERLKKSVIIASCVLLAVSLITLTVYTVKVNSRVYVPTVTDMTQEEAKAAIEDAKLTYYVIQFKSSGQVEEGKIISQTPEAGSVVKKGTSVGVIVSSGPQVVRVPDVKGLYEAEAVSKLKKAGFSVSEIKYENNTEYKNGQVFDQSPGKDVLVEEGTEITLFVSLGKDSTTVPNLLGETLEEAKKLLSAAGLKLGGTDYEVSSKYAKGTIIKQTPSAYSEADKNTSVDVVISLGNYVTKYIEYDVKGSGVIVEILVADVPGGKPLNREYMSSDENPESAGKHIKLAVTRSPGEYEYIIYENDIPEESGRINFQ
ncbi:MAG: serine/threonine protein kinase [Eubacteriaceae bacterium]|nr:serine/threonine protein kinase [Eubacteriaceae bacterium]